MNERPTPETDKLRCKIYDQGLPCVASYQEMVMHARRLERERDEARAIAKYWQEQYGHSNPEHEWQALPWDKEGGTQ